MKQTRLIEITVGLFVAAGMAALFVLAMKVSNITTAGDDSGYSVTARFENIGGLKARAPVTMGGVRIGRVAHIRFDDHGYEAVVTLKIDDQYRRLPDDTSASIYTAGLLGDQYVALEPGGSETFLKEGARVQHTQSAMIVEQLIGRFLFSKAAEGPSSAKEGPSN